MTWSAGAERIRELLASGELEVVEPSLEVANHLLDDAANHIASASTIAEASDLVGAITMVGKSAVATESKMRAMPALLRALKERGRGVHPTGTSTAASTRTVFSTSVYKSTAFSGAAIDMTRA